MKLAVSAAKPASVIRERAEGLRVLAFVSVMCHDGVIKVLLYYRVKNRLFARPSKLGMSIADLLP